MNHLLWAGWTGTAAGGEGRGTDEVTKIIPRGVEDRFTSGGICSFFLFMDPESCGIARMMYTYVTRRRVFLSEFYGCLILDVIGLL